MKLTDAKCRAATTKPGNTLTKHADGRGLYLETRAGSDSKRWFLKYRRPNGAESRLALGNFPDVTLRHARDKAQAARELVAQGVDPVAQRQEDQQAAQVAASNTFAAMAQSTYDALRPGWTDAYALRWWRHLESDVIPYIGAKPVHAITAADMLAVARRIEARGVVEMASRALKGSAVVFTHALAEGLVETNPAAIALPAIKKKPPVTHRAAVLERKQLAAMLRDLAVYSEGEGRHPFVQRAAQMQLLVAQRPNDVNRMLWADVDMDEAVWRIPRATMKGSLAAKADKKAKPHTVPLSRQALGIVRQQREAVPQGVPFVFPSTIPSRAKTTPISENTVNLAFKRLGFDMSAHGARAVFMTIAQEDLKVPEDHADAVLAHGKKGSLGDTYNRAEFLDERPRVMQRWADHLDFLAGGAKVVPMGSKRKARAA